MDPELTAHAVREMEELHDRVTRLEYSFRDIVHKARSMVPSITGHKGVDEPTQLMMFIKTHKIDPLATNTRDGRVHFEMHGEAWVVTHSGGKFTLSHSDESGNPTTAGKKAIVFNKLSDITKYLEALMKSHVDMRERPQVDIGLIKSYAGVISRGMARGGNEAY